MSVTVRTASPVSHPALPRAWGFCLGSHSGATLVGLILSVRSSLGHLQLQLQAG